MLLFSTVYGSGKPLLILHGLFGSSDNWATLARNWSASGTVITADLRNHGRSPHDEIWNYECMADDVLETMLALGHDRFSLCGHSMGGKVVMRFAEKYPQHVERIAVVDIAPRYYPPHHQDIIRGIEAVDVVTLSSRSQADVRMAVYVPDSGSRQFLLKNLFRTADNRFAWRFNFEVIRSKIEEVGMELPAISSRVPALFIAGGNSRYILESDKHDIARLFPNALVETIAGAGHWVHADKPIELSNLVLPWFFS